MRKNLFLFMLMTLCVGLVNVAAQEPPKTVKVISGGVVNGKATNLVKPVYPPAAKAVNASGAVNVQVTIDEEGSVISASAVSGHPLLRAAAVEAARASKFAPTMLSGQPVKVTGIIVYNFVAATPTESKEPYWALGLLLSLAQNLEPGLLEEMDGKSAEWDKILLDIGRDVPEEFAAQRELFAKLGTARGGERQQIAREISISLKNQLQGHQLWQLQVGDNLGVIMLEAIKFSLNKQGKNYRADEEALRSSLRNIKDYSDSIPAEMSPEFALIVKRIASFANKADFSNESVMTELHVNIKPLFEKFIDDEQ